MRTTRRNGIRFVLVFILCAAARSAAAQTYEILHTFALPGGHPVGPVVASPAGALYGTTTDAGVFARGSVFVMSPDGSGGFTYQTMHSFVGPEGETPHAALIFGADGNLYGSAIAGGAAGVGTLFRISPTGAFTRLHDFADGGGEQPSELFLASDGAFYGTTRAGGAHGGGTVFRLGADEAFSTVHDFDGATEGTQALAAPVQLGSFLYGTTNLGGANGIGTIYNVDMATDQTSKVYDFDSAVGANPAAALLRASDGNLYGTAVRGGNGFGSVFRMDASDTVTLFYAFNYNPDGREPVAPLIQLSDGKLYGTTDDGGAGAPPNTVARGSVFRIDTLGNFEWLASFYVDLPPPPPAPLAASLASPANTPLSAVTLGPDGFLYGTLGYPYGAVYRISPTDPQPPSFPQVFGAAEGPYYPEGPVTEANGALYTTAAASAAHGSLLRFDGPRMTVLHDFTGTNADGANPTTAGLLLASDGGLYGATPNGGYAVNGWGTLYRLTSGGVFETLHVFQPPEGAGTTAGLLEIPSGQFWGVASAGGTSNEGTIFRIDSAGAFSLLHQFYGPDGNGPFSGFALGTDGKLYATTAYGGPSDAGTIFTMDTLGTFTSNVYDFDGQHGVHPFAGLLGASDGNLYGMSSRGGASDAGVIFRFDGSGVTSVHDFDGTDGSTPVASLIEASDGKLYGTTTWGGANGFGNIFRIDTLGNFESLHDFEGGRPQASLLEAPDGAFYSSAGGGLGNAGVLYRLVLGDAMPSPTGTVPTSGRAAGGTLVAVTGSHLTDVSAVSIGGVVVTPPVHLDQSAVYTVSPSLTPGTLNDVTVELPPAPGGTFLVPAAWFADFNDVPQDDIFHADIETIFRAGITAGCGGGNYCRNDPVRRDQMAVFLLKAEHGSDYVPPACMPVFPDVACPGTFADWIGQLVTEGVTAGCGGGNYCPASPVTRAQMAVFLLKTKEGSSYAPPPASGIFGDVPQSDSFASWIEEIANRGITAGCQAAPPLYCPASPNTRGQMAVFLVKTFFP